MDEMLLKNIEFSSDIGDTYIEFGKRVKALTKNCNTRLELYDQLLILEKELDGINNENLPQLMGLMLHQDDKLRGRFDNLG